MASRPHGEALTGSLGAELEQALQLSDNAPALARTVKQLPYYSRKPSRQSRVNHNSKAYFSGHEKEPGYEIVCRHLAMAWLLQLESPSGKPDYRAFESKDAITRHIPASIQDALESLLTCSNDVQVIDHKGWGRFAAERFQAMERSGVRSTRMLLQSGVHTMAAELKLKRDEHGAPRYVLKVYDPNVTAAHKRLGSNDLVHVETGSLESFLKGERSLHRYFGKQDESLALGKTIESAVLVVGIPPGGLAGLPEQPSVNRRVSQELPQLDRSVMYHLVAAGMDGTLLDLKESVLQLAESNPEAAFDLLRARNHANKHGLASAVVENRARGVEAFCEIVNASVLSAEKKAALLAGHTGDEDLPALCAGMTVGSATACKVLVDGIVNSGLDDTLRTKLLASRTDGTPALAVAAQLGRSDVIHVFVEGIAKADLPDETKLELLLARQADGVPGLVTAMANDWADGTEAFVRSVLQSDLPLPVKVKALRAEYEGCSALEIAESHEAANAVAAFQNAMRA